MSTLKYNMQRKLILKKKETAQGNAAPVKTDPKLKGLYSHQLVRI